MKNTHAIGGVCRQLIKVCERIESMSFDMEQFEQGNPELLDVYAGLRMDELEHAQVLTLNLTDLIAQGTDEPSGANGDGADAGVFAAGDLTDTAGEADDGEGKGGKKE